MKCSVCGKEIEKSASEYASVCEVCDKEIKEKIKFKNNTQDSNSSSSISKNKKENNFSWGIGILIGILIVIPFAIKLKISQKDYISKISTLEEKIQILEEENFSSNNKISNLNKTIKNLENQISSFDTSEYTKKVDELNSEISSLTAQRDSLNTEIKKMTSAEDTILTAGNYVVGTDIKAGKYDAIAQSGNGNLFVHGTTRVNEMLGVDDEFYIPSYKNITLKDGDTIEITSSLKILFQAK